MKVTFMTVYFLLTLSDLAVGFLEGILDAHWCSEDAECVSFCKTESSHCGRLVNICVCSGGHVKPTTATTSTTTTTITTTTTTTTTTTKPLVPLDCIDQKISVIESIAENLHVEDDMAGLCPGTNKHQTSDALVIHKCNATARSSWMPSLKSVQLDCSKNAIQPYTPISTFYNSENNVAGFFIDCTVKEDGIDLKMALQTCSDPPKIMVLNETTNPKISDLFTIFQRI